MIYRTAIMNILHISTFDNVGGAARVAYSLKETYKELGHNSQILVGQKTENSDDIIPIPSGTIQKLAARIANKLSLQYMGYLNSFDIKRNQAFLEADIIHFHNIHGGYFNFLALPGLTKSKPAVWTLHDIWAITGRCAFSYGCDRWQIGCGNCPDTSYYPASKNDTSKLLWSLKKWVYNRSNLVIVTPSKWLKNLVENSILAEKEIHLIYNGIDHHKFHPVDKSIIRKKLGLPDDKIILMFIASGGINNPQKGGKYLLESLKNINSKNVFFLNIGSSDEIDKIIHKEVDYLSIPYIHDEDLLPEYYAASDLLLFPSTEENCPLVILEAMACGTPVVAFNTGGIPELIEQLKTGYVAKYKDADDFIKGINIFIDDKSLRENAGKRARDVVEKHFTLDKMAGLYLDLYCKASLFIM